jgi:hypothetical protein
MKVPDVYSTRRKPAVREEMEDQGNITSGDSDDEEPDTESSVDAQLEISKIRKANLQLLFRVSGLKTGG